MATFGGPVPAPVHYAVASETNPRADLFPKPLQSLAYEPASKSAIRLRKQFFQKANTIPVIGTWTEDFALISFGQKYYNGQGLAVKQVRIKGDWKTVKERKSIAGHLFGTVKRVMGTDCHLYKGKAGGKFAQAFRTWNLKRAINIPGTEKLPKAHA